MHINLIVCDLVGTTLISKSAVIFEPIHGHKYHPLMHISHSKYRHPRCKSIVVIRTFARDFIFGEDIVNPYLPSAI